MFDVMPSSATSYLDIKEQECLEVSPSVQGGLNHLWVNVQGTMAKVILHPPVNTSAALSEEGLEKEPENEKTNELWEEYLERQNLYRSVMQRIAYLKRLGSEEEIVVSEKSSEFLNLFFMKNLIGVKPSIFLLDNGNFRALWEGEGGQQIGLQFRPEGNIQYVIFARRTGSNELARSYGLDTPEVINRLVEANRLRHLLYS